MKTRKTQEEINNYLLNTPIRGAQNLFDIENCLNNDGLELPDNVIISRSGIGSIEFIKWYEGLGYPTTYKECCDVLHINTMNNDAKGYEADLIIRFQELLIARNAYWKIAGEQLGLGKSWEPDWENKEETKYCITTVENQVKIVTAINFNYFLSFPTREICSDFLNNFNIPIYKSKKLL